MPLQKNQILTLRIERLSSDGSGVAHSADGEAVFVPGTAPGLSSNLHDQLLPKRKSRFSCELVPARHCQLW